MTYVFECKKCAKEVDVELTFAEYDEKKKNLPCSDCGSIMTRVFTPIGLTMYKGKGFYDTDSRGVTSR